MKDINILKRFKLKKNGTNVKTGLIVITLISLLVFIIH
jgi:hypothetical protein